MKILSPDNYDKLIAPLKSVAINNLFARSVVEHKVSGIIYVDNTDDPKSYYVIHPYGMSLLFGDSDNEDFNEWFHTYALNSDRLRDRHEWMQAFPHQWHERLAQLFNDRLVKSADNQTGRTTGIVERNTRVNFKFDHAAYLALPKIAPGSDVTIARTDRPAFRAMQGSVTPRYFWESEDDFIENGVGFSLFEQGALAATAFSSFVHDDQLELGIETLPAFRGKGYASTVCAALLDYCIENEFEPIWSCRLENIGSYQLAQKIGFVPTIEVPYYRLSK